MKLEGKDSKFTEFQDFKLQTQRHLFSTRQSHRKMYKYLEYSNSATEKDITRIDEQNLVQQSLKYEESYLENQINFCKEYKTPQLRKALNQEKYEQYINLDPSITQQEINDKILFLENEREERKKLNEKFQETLELKKQAEKLYRQKKKFQEDFPQLLNQLEQASLGIQAQLEITQSLNAINIAQASHLPHPLNTLFTKLNYFKSQCPSFQIELEIKGDFDKIEGFYEKYHTQLMYNPKFSHKSLRNQANNLIEQSQLIEDPLHQNQQIQKNSQSKSKQSKNQDRSSKEEEGQIPGIAENSKKIKKDKKKKRNAKSSSQGRNGAPIGPLAQNQISKQDGLMGKPVLEEGEDEELNDDINLLNQDQQFDLEEEPKELLIDKYERFPLYLEVEIKQNAQFFEFLKPFNQANQFSISILKERTKTQLALKMFPIQLRIFFIPELNILTVQFRSKEIFTTDRVLGKLFLDKIGKEIQFRESQIIRSNSDERVYIWLHYLAGLNLDLKNLDPLREMPNFVISEQKLQISQDLKMVTTSSLFSCMWSRLLSISLLDLQIKTFQADKTFVKEVQTELNKIREFQIIQSSYDILQFKEIQNSQDNHSTFEMIIGREKQAQYIANIQIPLDYPHSPPLFTLRNYSNQSQSFMFNFSHELLTKIDESDLRKVEELRPQGGYLSSGEPIQSILHSIEDELHLYYEEYCQRKKYQDFLLSFQVRKLLSCLEILNETSKVKEERKGQGAHNFGIVNLYKKAVKGRFKKRPFCFNENQNMFEQR